MGTPLFDVPFCILDLETTGGSPRDCEITEIGAVRYRRGQIEGTFQTLVNPGVPLPPFITVLTGITQAMVVEAPRIEEALPSFIEFVGDAVIVGHNVRFDLSFLNAAAERLGYQRFPKRFIDTVGLARRLVRPEVRNLKLGTLAAHFRSPVTPNHRALEDAKATAHVLFALLERAGTMGVTALEDLYQLPTAKGSPTYHKLHLTDSLPRTPGVYQFIDRNGTIFYVGKAKNLRTRVRSYFYGDTRRSVTNMLRELDRVDHLPCATEIEAEIAEVRLIHAHRPRHNRRSRPPKANHFVTLTDERLPRVSITRSVKPAEAITLGPFRSHRLASVVRDALWDAAPLRRCTGRPGSRSAPCSFSQMGVAACACAGDLDETAYAAVVERVRVGLSTTPRLVLEPLADRVRTLATEQRYEEAAWVRDRHTALARAIERRRAWHAMNQAGRIWAEALDAAVCIDHGRLTAAWRHGDQPPLIPPAVAVETVLQVPDSALAAEEAHLLWRWLTSGSVRLLETGGPLSSPASAIPPLTIAA